MLGALKRTFETVSVVLVGCATCLASDFSTTFDYECADCSAPLVKNLQAHFEAAVLRGIDSWTSVIHDDVSVDVNVQVQSLASLEVGQSLESTVSVPYNFYRNRLINAKRGVPLFSTVKSLPTTLAQLNFDLPPSVTSLGDDIDISRTLHKVLDPSAPDPSITLVLNSNMINAGITPAEQAFGTYDLNILDGIDSTHWDLQSVVTREMGRALGFQSNATTTASVVQPTALDLFVFSDGGDPGQGVTFAGATRSLDGAASRVFDNLVVEVPMTSDAGATDYGFWQGDNEGGTSTGLLEDELHAGEISLIFDADRYALDSMGYGVLGAECTPEKPIPMPGDVFVDCVVDAKDQDPFVDLIPLSPYGEGEGSETHYVAQQAAAGHNISIDNGNFDGFKVAIDLFDVDPFTDCLQTGDCDGDDGGEQIVLPSGLEALFGQADFGVASAIGPVSVPEPSMIGVLGYAIMLIFMRRRPGQS